MTKADRFLNEHGKKLTSFEFCQGVDNNQDPPELWDQAELRVLIVFLSDGYTRSVSNTFTIIQNMLKTTYGDRIFIDHVYMPDRPDFRHYKQGHQGFLFGNVSHREWHEYDLVALSVSIAQELWNVPFIFDFNGIPMDFEERMANEQIPLIMLAGVASTMADIVYGDYEPGKGCLVDCTYVGHIEPGHKPVFDYLLEHDTNKGKREHLYALDKVSKHILVPRFYDYDWRLDDKIGYVINSITPHKGVKKQAQFAHMDHMQYPGFERKVLNCRGNASANGDLDLSSGCSGGGACTFCYEGVVAGKWLERPMNLIVERMRKLRRSAAPNTLGFYSYNLNYFGKFIDLLHESAKRFSNLSLINMRTDVIGAEPRYMDISILLGLRRASAAVEGMGPRIRDNLLNKNLTIDQWKAAASVIFQARLAEYKIGMIFTGYETDQDMEDSLNEFKEILKLRDELGSNTSLRVTVTPLIYYPHTPLQRLKRETPLQSLRGERKFDRFLYGMKDLGIRIKVNGRGKSPFIEQFIMDFGRAGTKHLVHTVREQPGFYGMLPKELQERLFDSFAQEGINPQTFCMARGEEALLWSSAVRTLNPKYYERWIGDARENPQLAFKSRQCTTSPANVPKWNIPIEVIGTKKEEYVATCQDCGQCKSVDEQHLTVSRPTESKTGFNEVMLAINTSRPRAMTSIGVQIKPEYFYVSSKMLSHRITGMILDMYPKDLEPKYFQVGKTSFNWIAEFDQRDFYSGRFVFPVFWNDNKVKIPEDVRQRLNEGLRSCSVYHISDTLIPDKRFVKKEDVTLWRIHTRSFTARYFREAFLSFDEKVPFAQKALRRELILEDKYTPNLLSPVAIDKGDTCLVYVALPIAMNPYFYIGKIMDRNFQTMLNALDISSILTMRKSGKPCQTCSKIVYDDILRRMNLKQCPACVSKIMVSREINV